VLLLTKQNLEKPTRDKIMKTTTNDYIKCTNYLSYLELEKHPKTDDSFEGVQDIEFYHHGEDKNNGSVEIIYF
jgi:hypothetical protein